MWVMLAFVVCSYKLARQLPDCVLVSAQAAISWEISHREQILIQPVNT